MSNASNVESREFCMECIETALFELMQNKPYQKITFSDIAAKAGTSRNAIYRNFSSKEDILEQYLKRKTVSFLNSTYDLKTYRDYLSAVFAHLETIKTECIAVYKTGHINVLFSTFLLFKNRFETENDTVREFYEYYRVGGVFCVYLHWLASGCKESPDALCDMVFRLVKGPGIIPEWEG